MTIKAYGARAGDVKYRFVIDNASLSLNECGFH